MAWIWPCCRLKVVSEHCLNLSALQGVGLYHMNNSRTQRGTHSPTTVSREIFQEIFSRKLLVFRRCDTEIFFVNGAHSRSTDVACTSRWVIQYSSPAQWCRWCARINNHIRYGDRRYGMNNNIMKKKACVDCVEEHMFSVGQYPHSQTSWWPCELWEPMISPFIMTCTQTTRWECVPLKYSNGRIDVCRYAKFQRHWTNLFAVCDECGMIQVIQLKDLPTSEDCGVLIMNVWFINRNTLNCQL